MILSDMKQIILALSLMLTLSVGQVSGQAKHRHHLPQVTNTVVKDTATKGVEAYSDTTSLGDVDSTGAVVDTMANHHSQGSGYSASWDSDDDFFPGLFHHPEWGIPMVFLAIIAVVLGLFFLLLPLIIVIMVLRHLIKRHNDRVMLAQKAMENGQPIPDEIKPVDKQSADFLWRRGIRNVAIGLGLMIMFGIWDANALVGVGALVMCWGIGQLIISKTSNKKQEE